MSKSTPTPWIDGPYGEIWVGIHRNADGKWDEDTPATPDAPSSAIIVASAKKLADRALILRAVNSHTAMLAAVEAYAEARIATPPGWDVIQLAVADKLADAALRLSAPAEGDAA